MEKPNRVRKMDPYKRKKIIFDELDILWDDYEECFNPLPNTNDQESEIITKDDN